MSQAQTVDDEVEGRVGNIGYRGVGLIRTMEIVKKSSELAQPCGFKSFDLKNEFLIRRANYFSYIRPNITSTYSLTQFLHT